MIDEIRRREIWRKPRVLRTISMGKTWLHEEVRAGRFPPPVKLGHRAVGWRASDVLDWLDSRSQQQRD
jgi:prophage regulatory protein